MANFMINGASQKETHFFDLFHERGVRWYHRHFDFKAGSLSGECTPFYLMHPEAPKRAYRYNPGLKLIAILRNPTERAWSHYLMNREAQREQLSFTEALASEDKRLAESSDITDPNSNFLHFSYQHRGRYAEQLDHWLNYFSPEQLLVINYHDFFRDPWQAVQEVYRFLGAAPLYDTILHHENSGKLKDNIPPEAAKSLNDYFREPNAQLAKKYGIRF